MKTKQQEERGYMIVKKINEDGEFVYFEVLSNCCVHGLILKMDVELFVKYFGREDTGMADFVHIYRSRDFIFPEKVSWWNTNVDEVLFLVKANTLETEAKLLDFQEEYKKKYHTNSAEFLLELYFFENFLEAYELGSASTFKRIGKKRKGHDRYRN